MKTDTPTAMQFRVDAWLPAEMAERAENVGVKKASLDFWSMLALGILAGAFIALGALFATTVTASPLRREPLDRRFGILFGSDTGDRGGSGTLYR